MTRQKWCIVQLNKLISEGGHTKALDWREYDMAEEVYEWKAQHR